VVAGGVILAATRRGGDDAAVATLANADARKGPVATVESDAGNTLAAAVDASIPEPEHGSAASAAAATAPSRPAVARPAVHPHAPPGEVSIDSSPFASVSIDGRAIGITPLLHASLPAGRHRIRLVLRDGRTRELDVDVPAGRAAPPVTVHW
jgi:hypothetical protein